jgi:hypothetical protein
MATRIIKAHEPENCFESYPNAEMDTMGYHIDEIGPSHID